MSALASTDSLGIELGTASAPEAPPKKAAAPKKGGARAKASTQQDDFNFKFGFSFQSPAKTIR